jgi:hypothetical protein
MMSNTQNFVSPYPLSTAVLFLIFNRLDTTKQVFKAIRQAKPPYLYVAADGPRENKEGEVERVQAVRDYVMDSIDWDCEVKTLFREKNLGCKYAVSGGITWFFENEDQGIILEDDCLPSQSFFWFCEELLDLYKIDNRIFMISGYNKKNQYLEAEKSYFFSNLGGIWGWASWRRAWQEYDVEMKDIEAFIRQNHFRNLLGNRLGRLREKEIYQSIVVDKMNTWDYQWGFARHKNSGISCVPTSSLIENIGFGPDATHTQGAKDDGVISWEIKFPLKKEKFLICDKEYDNFFIGLSGFNLKSFVYNLLKSIPVLRPLLERIKKSVGVWR